MDLWETRSWTKGELDWIWIRVEMSWREGFRMLEGDLPHIKVN